VDVTSEGVTMTATDGYILAVWNGGPALAGSEPWSAIVPTTALEEVARNLTPEGRVELALPTDSRRVVRFTGDGLHITTRLADGTYPDTKAVFPAQFTSKARVDRGALRQALKRAELVCGDKANKIDVSVNGNLTISAESAARGSAVEELDAELDGERFNLSLNASYFGSVLDRIDTPIVELWFPGPLRPLQVTAADADDGPRARYLVMPLRAA
jgi:DNA polymerase-3 subunit beta